MLNNIPCAKRRCGENCYHMLAGRINVCVVPLGDPPSRFEVKYGDPCKHMDEDYTEAATLLQKQPQITLAERSPEQIDHDIRLAEGIPDNVSVTDIDRANYQNQAMAEVFAIMNARPAPTLM